MKKVLLVSTLLLASLVVVACGNNPSSSANNSTSNNDSLSVNSNNDSNSDSTSDATSDSSVEPLTKEQMAEKLVKDFENAIEAASKVKSITFDSGYVYDESEYDPEPTTLTYGSNDAVYYTTSDWGLVTKHYAYKDAEGNVYGYNIDVDERVLPDSVTEDSLKGFDYSRIAGIYNPSALTASAYSLETLAKVSADTAKANEQKDLVIEMPTDNSYHVKFNAMYTDEYDYKNYWTVEFDAEFDEVSKALVKFNSKTWMHLPDDVELDEEGIFEVINEAGSSNVFNYTATIGTREVITLPYDVASFYYESFGLTYNDTKVNENDLIEVDVAFGSYEPISFTLSDVLPSTANSRFDTINVVCYADGSEESTWDLSGYVTNGQLDLSANAGGTYKVELTTRDTSFTFNVKVNMSLPTPESFNFYRVEYFDLGDFAYYGQDDVKKEYLKDSTLWFGATVEPYGADGSYTMSLSLNGTDVALTKTEYDEWGTTKYYYAVTLNELGTYTLKATSTVDPTVSSEKTFSIVNELSEEDDGEMGIYNN